MIHRLGNDGEYMIDGVSCKRVVEEALRRGWAKRSRVVEVEGGTADVIPMPIPPPSSAPTGAPKSQLEEAARRAGMSVDELIEMRMRTQARVDRVKGDDAN